MLTVILIIHLLLAISLVVTVLLQRSEGGALGIGGGGGGGGGMGGLMTARGSANLLTRTTAFLAAGFMVTSLGLAILAGGTSQTESILDRPGTTAPATSQPSAPTAPAQPTGPSVPLEK